MYPLWLPFVCIAAGALVGLLFGWRAHVLWLEGKAIHRRNVEEADAVERWLNSDRTRPFPVPDLFDRR